MSQFVAERACHLNRENRSRQSVWGIGIIALLFVIAAIALQFLSWQGNRELHTVMEVVATLLAGVIGVLALARYYSKKNSVYLFLATGFLGTALLDGYHAVVTSSLLSYLMPSPPDSLIPWSWNASRTFLAILMTLMWGASKWEEKQGKTNPICEKCVYKVVGLLTLTSFFFFSCFPLPRAYYPEFFFGRPEEFIAALFFAIALFGFASRAVIKINAFETWLVWSLMVGFVAQAIVMSRSFRLFDLPFDLAHSLKIISYLLVLVGLLIEFHTLFHRLEESRTSLKKLSNSLVVQTDYANRMVLEAKAASVAKSQFLANMSHEIRTPMTAILGYADLLAGEEGLEKAPSERRDSILTIQRNAQHLLTIINDILDMSKIEAGKTVIEQIDVCPITVVEEVVSLIQSRAEGKGINLAVKYDTPVPAKIQSDPTRVRQILLNLLGNAIKFTEIGNVTIHVSADSSKQLLQMSVVDTGIGMTVEQRDTIARFEAFAQADGSTTRHFGGTGLGLRISNSLAQLLGGSIQVKSQWGKGSTFSVTVSTGDLTNTEMLLPMIINRQDHKTTVNEETLSNSSIKKPLAGLRLLLAEDGPDNQRLISFLLKKAGAEMTVAENGQIAIDKVNEAMMSGEHYDVILMDMQMPTLDGYKATTQLRQAGYTRPIIALTAHAMADDRQKCIEAGCDEFASKPIDQKKLINLIKMSVINDETAMSSFSR